MRHSCRVEYYLHELDIGHDDPDRPHDIAGPGSKYEWGVVKGLALQYRGLEFELQYPANPDDCEDTDVFKEYVLPSIRIHRENQHHHIMGTGNNPLASDDDMKVTAVDTICSRLEERTYQGGAHTFEELVSVIKNIDPRRAKHMWPVYSQMKTLPQPDVKLIQDLERFPNIGIPDKMYDRTIFLTNSAVQMLKQEYGYSDL